MRRIARLVTICLLLVAVPVKGAVAVTMVMCGPGHEGVSSASVGEGEITPGSISSAQHDHASHHHASDASGKPNQDAGPLDHEGRATHGVMKCSICAACCVGGAFLVSAEVLMPASVGTEASFQTLEVRFSGIVIAGLERPPRTFLV